MTTGSPRILLIGTADTKSDELLFMRGRIEAGGGEALVMDVGILGQAPFAPDIANAEVAAAADTTLAQLAALGDENAAMSRMAQGAARLTATLHAEGRIDGLLALGGTMGTDLALDAAAALPVGVPKVVVSTIAYSHLLPPERIPADLVMLLWAGGLYGLNDLCRSSLAQAVGAVLGACRLAQPPRLVRPLVGITSLGSSVLSYMKRLKPALEARGYEVAVFHTTGMG
ncbi:MAG: Tm-1-like ATP-binding domain-containing protein, partial [Rhodocyclaceae bacterium]|nr:Tm-1-like ATP-binding domain-containing protein [Rhodocyclaceae bacterium]